MHSGALFKPFKRPRPTPGFVVSEGEHLFRGNQLFHPPHTHIPTDCAVLQRKPHPIAACGHCPSKLSPTQTHHGLCRCPTSQRTPARPCALPALYLGWPGLGLCAPHARGPFSDGARHGTRRDRVSVCISSSTARRCPCGCLCALSHHQHRHAQTCGCS